MGAHTLQDNGPGRPVSKTGPAEPRRSGGRPSASQAHVSNRAMWYRRLLLESLVTPGKRMLAGDVPEGATTGDRISNTERAAVERSEADANGCGRTREATG